MSNPYAEKLMAAERRLERLEKKQEALRQSAIPSTYITGNSGIPASRRRKLDQQLDRTIDLAVAYEKQREKVAEIRGKFNAYNDGLIDEHGRRIITQEEKEARVAERVAVRERRKRMSPEDGLFIGCYPEGLVYADKRSIKGGDYRKIAFLSYRTLELSLYNPPADMLPLIEASAERMRKKRGKQYQISTCGQYVILGE